MLSSEISSTISQVFGLLPNTNPRSIFLGFCSRKASLSASGSPSKCFQIANSNAGLGARLAVSVGPCVTPAGGFGLCMADIGLADKIFVDEGVGRGACCAGLGAGDLRKVLKISRVFVA